MRPIDFFCSGLNNNNNDNNNNNSLHLYSAFLGTQSALHCEGISSSIHLDDVTAATTHQLTGGEETVLKPISGYGDY